MYSCVVQVSFSLILLKISSKKLYLKVPERVWAEEQSIVESDGATKVGAGHDGAHAGHRVSVVNLRVKLSMKYCCTFSDN